MHEINHKHDHGIEGTLSEREKLLKRIEHWKHHNEEHIKNYKEWALNVEKMGLKDVSFLLEEVCKKAEEQGMLFQKIIDLIKG